MSKSARFNATTMEITMSRSPRSALKRHAGFGEAQLEDAIGCAVPTFVTRAYTDAASVWHSSKRKLADRH